METARDIFFFIGSVLGILAFFRTLFEPVVSSNREKWSKVKQVLKETDLIDLEHEVDQARCVHQDTLSRLSRFSEDVRQDAEYLRFGPLWRREFEQRKNRIAELYRDLRKYIQVPYWRPKYYGREEEGESQEVWDFDKEHFYTKVENGHNVYVDHLEEAAQLVEEIRKEYRYLSILANLHMVEIPIGPWIANSRSKAPYDAK